MNVYEKGRPIFGPEEEKQMSNHAPAMSIKSLDHIVLTVGDIDKTIKFYVEVLGLEVVNYSGGKRFALHFGDQKINLHEAGKEIKPNAKKPVAGSADFCFVSETSVDIWTAHLSGKGIKIVRGPVETVGALGKIRSVYIRDPDENLVEIANY